MTKLFQEYEFKRLARKNPQSLIGKKFCWNYTKSSFTITKVIDDDYMEYQYEEDGSTLRRYLSTILEKSTLITE